MPTTGNCKPERELKVLAHSEIEAQIAEGRHIFILNDKVIKADAWLAYHPGGPQSIKHMVGRDATDEVTAYVPAYDSGNRSG
jgi:delta8-fatty-acid desaturase